MGSKNDTRTFGSRRSGKGSGGAGLGRGVGSLLRAVEETAGDIFGVAVAERYVADDAKDVSEGGRSGRIDEPFALVNDDREIDEAVVAMDPLAWTFDG